MYAIFRDFVIDKLNANDLYAQLSKGEGNTFDERVASVMELYAKNGVDLTKEQAERKSRRRARSSPTPFRSY